MHTHRRPGRQRNLTVPGIPATLADPGELTPTPWETYTYDANDNAGRTHPTVSLQFADHWNTPASTVLDAFGRTVTAAARTADETLITATSYDIDGHPLTVTDPLGRPCAGTVYDLAGQPWRSWLLDAGTTRTVRDADRRPRRATRRQGRHHPVRLRPRPPPRHGCGPPTAPGRHRRCAPSPSTATTRPTPASPPTGLGRQRPRPARAQLDEAGQVTTTRYDLNGNP